MTLEIFFKIIFGIGFVLAIISVRHRSWNVELSTRLTGIGWILLGIGIVGMSSTTNYFETSVWPDLAWLFQVVAGFLGGTYVVLGIRRLLHVRDKDEGIIVSDRDDIVTRLIFTDPDGKRRKKGLTMVTIGFTLFMLIVWGSVTEMTIDGQPLSYLFVGFLAVGLFLVLFGREHLKRLADKKD